VPGERVHVIEVGGRAPAEVAAAYGETLTHELGVLAALDVVVLDLGDAGELAGVLPGSAALASTAPVVAVEADGREAAARVTLTPATWRAARHVVVTATGAARAEPLAAALRAPAEPARYPAQAVLPSASASWFVDRAAAERLLRDAQPVVAGQ
jgi:6-phosphogluconolactonase